MNFRSATYNPYQIAKPQPGIFNPRGDLFIAQARQQRNQINMGVKNHLELFPHWVGKQIQTKPPTQTQVIAASIKDQNSQFMAFLDRAGQVKWDVNNQSWTGELVADSLKNQYSRAKNQYNQALKHKAILQTSISQQQIQKDIPVLIKDIILANQALSQTGIGPKSMKGMPLYAGRIYNQQTKRVQLLPKASTRLLNPTSLQQKKGYLQAKLINLWNSYVATAQQYQKANAMSPQLYASKKGASIAKSLLKGSDNQSWSSLKAFYLKIRRAIIKYLAGAYKQYSVAYYAIAAIISQLQKTNSGIAQFFEIDVKDPLNQAALLGQLQTVSNIVSDLVSKAKVQVNAIAGMDDKSKEKNIKALIRALQGYNFKASSRLITPIVNAYKAISFPNKLTVNQITPLAKGFKQGVQKLRGAYFDTDMTQQLLKQAANLSTKVLDNTQPLTVNALQADKYQQAYRRKNAQYNLAPKKDVYGRLVVPPNAGQYQGQIDRNSILKGLTQQGYDSNFAQYRLFPANSRPRSRVGSQSGSQSGNQGDGQPPVQPSGPPAVGPVFQPPQDTMNLGVQMKEMVINAFRDLNPTQRKNVGDAQRAWSASQTNTNLTNMSNQYDSYVPSVMAIVQISFVIYAVEFPDGVTRAQFEGLKDLSQLYKFIVLNKGRVTAETIFNKIFNSTGDLRATFNALSNIGQMYKIARRQRSQSESRG